MKKIMIVDDNEDIVETMATILKNQSYIVETACDGKDFLEKKTTFKPDLVLLDVMMPGLTTKDILEKLEAEKNKVNVILTTVVRFSKKEIADLKKGKIIIDYIPKPFDVIDLINKVKKYLP